jgi:hypothetical protein
MVVFLSFLGEKFRPLRRTTKGAALGTCHLLKKVDQNFFCMGMQKLCVILCHGSRGSPLPKNEKPSKLVFVVFCARTHAASSEAAQNDLEIRTNIVFVLSFVWCKNGTHFVFCKRF